MPDEEHKLTIQVATNAGEAAKEFERLDDAQQNAANSGERLKQTTRGNTAAESRRLRLLAKYIKSYLRDIQAIRKNTERLNKSEKTLDRDSAKGEYRAIRNSNLMLKRLLAVAGAIALIKRGFQSLGNSLDFGKNYLLAGAMTGTNAVNAQMWERLLRPFGGNLGSAAGSLGAIQRNIALANMGEMPFNDMAFRLLGPSIMTRPGMTQEEFLRNIAPRMKNLSRGEALLAGRSVGLTDDMSLMLNKFGADFEKELEKQRKAALVSQKNAEDAQKNRQKFDDIVQGSKNRVFELANKIFELLPDEVISLQNIGKIATDVGVIASVITGVKFLKWFLGGGAGAAAGAGAGGAGGGSSGLLGGIAHTIFNPITAGIFSRLGVAGLASIPFGIFYLMNRAARGAQEEKYALPPKSAPFDPTKNLPKTPIIPGKQQGAFNTNTPLNFMTPQIAWMAGLRGGGDNILNLGGITINAPSGDPDAIAERVIDAGGVVLAEFSALDRLNAKNEWA